MNASRAGPSADEAVAAQLPAEVPAEVPTEVPADWPLREYSHRVVAGGLAWHLQRVPAAVDAPTVLLLHGTGASSHSFHGLVSWLGTRVDAIVVDLPGHGFSASLPPARSTSLGFAAALAALLEQLAVRPVLVVGHSAGAAVALRLVRNPRHAGAAVLALNGAPVALGGAPGRLFAPLARLLAERTSVVGLITGRARRAGAVARLLKATGSTIDQGDLALYQRLLSRPAHVAGTLRMMANWDLDDLEPTLGELRASVHLVQADGDLTLPPSYRARVRERLPMATTSVLSGLGHLAHEEAPERVGELVLEALRAAGCSVPCGTVGVAAAGARSGDSAPEQAST